MRDMIVGRAYSNVIPAMSDQAIDQVRALETASKELAQVSIATLHHLHAGVYARTITIPAGVVLTGALIKRSTVLVINGHVRVFIGDEPYEIQGYQVIAASAGRKQAFAAITDTSLTMFFATSAKTVEQAEEEFTDEASLLFSRSPDAFNHQVITGE